MRKNAIFSKNRDFFQKIMIFSKIAGRAVGLPGAAERLLFRGDALLGTKICFFAWATQLVRTQILRRIRCANKKYGLSSRIFSSWNSLDQLHRPAAGPVESRLAPSPLRYDERSPFGTSIHAIVRALTLLQYREQYCVATKFRLVINPVCLILIKR